MFRPIPGSSSGVHEYLVSDFRLASGLFPSSGIPKKHDVSETGSLLHWLRLALSKGPNWVGVFSPTFIWGRKQIEFPKRRVFWNTGRWKKSRKILWVLYNIHHRQNPFKSTKLLTRYLTRVWNCARIYNTCIYVRRSLWLYSPQLPSNLDQAESLLTFIQEVPSSNLVRDNGYPGWDISWFPLFLPCN
jgi:hypothetical protein